MGIEDNKIQFGEQNIKSVCMSAEKRISLVNKIKSLPVLNYDSGPSKNYTRKNLSVKLTGKLSSPFQPKNYSNEKSLFSRTTHQQAFIKKQPRHNFNSLKQHGKLTQDNFYLDEGLHNFKIKQKMKFIAKSKGKITEANIYRNVRSVLDKPKISSKCSGNIIAYGVNSHAGSYNPINEDRICIATTLRKNDPVCEASLFGIFSGKNGITKAEYFRDNFHKLLTAEPLLLIDTEKALTKTYQTIERQYHNTEIANGDYSTVSFIITVLIVFHEENQNKNQIYMFQSGQNRSFISTNFGKTILKPFKSRFEHLEETFEYSSMHEYRKIKKEKHTRPLTEKISDCQNVDYLVLASQPFFHKKKEEQHARQIWKYLLAGEKNERKKQTETSFVFCQESISEKIGVAVNRIMSHTLMNQASGSLSMIIIGLKQLNECFDTQPRNFQLPFLTQTRNSLQQIQLDIIN